MGSRWMRWALQLALGVAVAGCGTRGEQTATEATETSEAREQAYGSLHLPLVTPEQAAFRLRGARFAITRANATVLTLDSESDPGAVSLDAELLQGAYEITLADGWVLERQGDAGAGPVPAALLTANPLAFEVENARVTEIVYAFTTEQGVVTFGRGEASVSFQVTAATPSSTCSVLQRSSCPDEQTCLLAGDTGRTFCAQPGALPVGAPCSSEQCVAGAQCLSTDPSHPEQRMCARFCNPASSFCGCQGLSVDPGIGLCTQVTSGTAFSHEFAPGDTLACSEWNQFRSQLLSPSFTRVTLSGSRGGSFECTDPLAASQICRALRDDGFTNVSCQGHTWRVNDCGGGPELAVDSFPCSCDFPGNTVRPCNTGGLGFGGVGTDTCSSIPQGIEVTCDSGPPPPAVCGNGVIEAPEVCDTNGIFTDTLPPGTPSTSSCNANCTAINASGDGVCLSCAQTRCPTQFNDALGTTSSANNTALVTALFDCVIGQNWEAGIRIPATSCYFSNPNQPRGTLLPCYCGSTPEAQCLATGPVDHNQACGVQMEQASQCNPLTSSCVTQSGGNPAVALGDALQLLNCEKAACESECGFPPIPVED